MEFHIVKGPVKTVRGVRCQTWITERQEMPRPGSKAEPPSRDETCLDVKNHFVMEQRSPGQNPLHATVMTFYDWNKPIEIKPPQ